MPNLPFPAKGQLIPIKVLSIVVSITGVYMENMALTSHDHIQFMIVVQTIIPIVKLFFLRNLLANYITLAFVLLSLPYQIL